MGLSNNNKTLKIDSCNDYRVNWWDTPSTNILAATIKKPTLCFCPNDYAIVDLDKKPNIGELCLTGSKYVTIFNGQNDVIGKIIGVKKYIVNPLINQIYIN